MSPNRYEIARVIFIFSFISMIIICLLFILPIYATVHTQTENISHTMGTHMSFFLIGTIPPLISLIGYFIIEIEEEKGTIENRTAFFSACLVIICWISIILGFYQIFQFRTNFGLLITLSILSFLIWISLLIGRIRYLSLRIKQRMEQGQLIFNNSVQ